ncbi:MAG: NAD-dependent epimerase/dehydratase family protein [Promethearchaeota archaeon]
MRVLVTGGNGFIGNLMLPRLSELEYDVYCLERYVTGRYVLGGQRLVKTVFGDLRDPFAVRKAVREVQPDAVIHLAAISAVSYSYNHPIDVMETNFLGTVNLAESCLREVPSFKRFLFAGTSEEYGNQKNIPIKETAELHPNSPYAVSKVAADKYLQYMHDAYDFPVTILRNFNTYGRINNTHFVVERIIVQMLQEKTARLGDPTPIRDFMYVEDHVNSYLACLNSDKTIGETLNFCTGRGVSIAQLAELITKLTDFEGDIVWDTIPKRPLDIAVLVGDCSKAEQLLGWKPKLMLEDGLRFTVDSWRNNLAEGSQ